MDYAQWSEAVRVSFRNFMDSLVEYLPSVLGAFALMLVGWVLARLLRALTRRAVRALDWLLASRVVEGAMKRVGVQRPAAEVIGGIVFWAVILFFATAATETLGLPVIATWVGGLSYYLPRVLVGLLIVAGGLLAGSLAGGAIRKAAGAAGLAYAPLLGQGAQAVILMIALVTAVDQLGIDTAFLTAMITILIGGVIGAAALAFGLGSRAHVGNLIAGHYLRQTYREGQTVRVAGVQGRIVEILATAVIIETPDGRVLVPAEEFSAKVSILVTAEG